MNLFKLEMKRIFITNKVWIYSALVIILRLICSLLYNPPAIEIQNYKGKFISGATAYIENFKVDWILIFFILILVTTVVIDEYRCEMRPFIKTCLQQKRLATIQLCIIFLTTFFVSLFSESISYAVYNYKFGTANALITQIGENYQSFSRFLSADKCSLQIILISSLGFTIFSAYVVLFSVVVKKSIPVYAFSISMVILPVYLFEKTYQRSRLWLPISLLNPKYFYMGTQIINEDNIYGNEYGFIEITAKECFFNIFVQCIVFAVITFAIWCFLSNKRINLRMIKSIGTALIAAFIFTGCSNTILASENETYLMLGDSCNYVYDKVSNKIIDVNSTPFEDKIIQSICDEYAIAISFLNEEKTSYEIQAISLKTKEVIPMLTVGKNLNTDGLLDLDDIIPLPPSFLYDFETFGLPLSFQYDDNVIFFEGSNCVISYDLNNNGKRTDLLADTPYYMPVCKSDKIYYLNKENQLCIYQDNKSDILIEDQVSFYFVTDNYIYYTCSKDNLLRKTNLDSTDVISDLQAQYIIYADDKSVTFSTEDGTVTVKDKKLYKTEIFADLADGENLYTFDGKDLIIYDLQGNIIDKQSVDMV